MSWVRGLLFAGIVAGKYLIGHVSQRNFERMVIVFSLLAAGRLLLT